MNFQTLRWMIESLVKTYKCPMCNSHVTENNIDIIWAAGTTVNIDVACGSCDKHSMIKIEVLAVDLTKKNISSDQLAELKSRFKNIKDVEVSTPNTSTESAIKDETIIDLSKDLKKWDLSVDDLFWEEL